MDTKHTPATPLPWKHWKQMRDGSENVVNVGSAFVCEVGVPRGDPEERDYLHDALYIAHAANAYPQLVAELKRIQNVVGEEDFDLIEGLLSELGEIAPLP